ncbi:glycosyltransferase [Synechococcus sp. A10-1-5-1]|uniref:glycosyltransferase n=1 Tax=Synechococcus sp. A10-1-5-1 TaxID=2936507 RepID=UPI0020007242|nr:glycosyltransferase [Synechococcus sp. A10-1-5-1]UPM49194.1 glycosyltransferase [Synechococcus sp. A10-1-5-1]
MKTELSIIIVVKNSKDDLRKTLHSIRANNTELLRASAEIVIIDGLSSDGSWELSTRAEQITGVRTQCYQQPPQGIYPAMNLGQYKSSGNWLIYINAGDIFHDCTNLSNILQQSRSSAIQFKSAIKRPSSRHAYTKSKQWDRCHQALVYRKGNHEILGRYNESLKICSDSLFIKNLEESRIEYADQILSITQVSPNNASRNPRLVREDLESLARFKIDHQPWRKPRLTLTVLRIEAALGSSTSVWALCHIGRLFSKYQKIDVSD